MQRSPTVALGESSVPTAGSPSHSGSSSENSNPENSLNGSRKRKRSFTISYVTAIYCGFERCLSVECSEADSLSRQLRVVQEEEGKMWYVLLRLFANSPNTSKTRSSLHVAGALAMAVFVSTRRSESPDFGLVTVKSLKRKSTGSKPLFKPWAAE
jgi:hypothetical protein